MGKEGGEGRDPNHTFWLRHRGEGLRDKDGRGKKGEGREGGNLGVLPPASRGIIGHGRLRSAKRFPRLFTRTIHLKTLLSVTDWLTFSRLVVVCVCDCVCVLDCCIIQRPLGCLNTNKWLFLLVEPNRQYQSMHH